MRSASGSGSGTRRKIWRRPSASERHESDANAATPAARTNARSGVRTAKSAPRPRRRWTRCPRRRRCTTTTASRSLTVQMPANLLNLSNYVKSPNIQKLKLRCLHTYQTRSFLRFIISSSGLPETLPLFKSTLYSASTILQARVRIPAGY